MLKMFIIFDYLFEYYFLFAISFLVLVIIKIYNNYYDSQLPPGPKGIPILGYLPFLGKEAHKDIAMLSKKHGNIFTMQLGFHKVVVLNDFEAMKTAFSKEQLLERPINTPFHVPEQQSFIFDNGNEWREQRSFSFKVLKDVGLGKKVLEDKINNEISYLIKDLDNTKGKAFDLYDRLQSILINDICQLVFGHRYDLNDPVKCELDRVLKHLYTRDRLGVLSVTPVLLSEILFFLDGLVNFNSMYNTLLIFAKLVNDEIVNHKNTLMPTRIRDYIDGYLDKMQTTKSIESSFWLNDKKLMANCRLILITVLESGPIIRFALIYCAHYTDIQKKIQEEIDCIIGRERNPEWADRVDMTFTQAFIYEILRLRPPNPLNLMRRTSEKTTILGHSIPKHTRVMGNIWAVHTDPKVWQNPLEFNPNRFMSTDGKQLINTEAVIPFSYGKRSCPGKELAKLQIFLYLTSILQKFNVRGIDRKSKSFEESLEFSLKEDRSLHYEPRI